MHRTREIKRNKKFVDMVYYIEDKMMQMHQEVNQKSA